MGALQSVESSDGTIIGFEVTGSGPPMLLVHGGVADRSRWAPVIGALSERFTLYRMDRRGRGASSKEKEPYDVEREGEDIAAVVNAVGPDVYLFGHSYGAVCSLEAALRTKAIARMALYEPPVSTPGHLVADPHVLARIRAQLTAGDREGALLIFYRDILHLPERDIEAMRPTAIWRARMEAVHTIVRELAVLNEFDISSRLSKIDIPVRIFLGTESAPYFQPTAEAILKHLPRADIVWLAGQDHIMMDRDPAGFIVKVFEFGNL